MKEFSGVFRTFPRPQRRLVKAGLGQRAPVLLLDLEPPQVHGHGLQDRVRDGVLLRVPRRCCPCEHAAQIPAVLSDDSGMPRLQFIDRVGHCNYVTLCRRPLRFLRASPWQG